MIIVTAHPLVHWT